MDAEQETKPLLSELAALTTREAEDEAGLLRYEDLRVKSPSDYQELSVENFRHLRAKLPLAEHLPKAPALHEYSFLLNNRSQIVTDQFHDSWSAGTLAYSAAAENFLAVTDLIEKGLIDNDHPLLTTARHSLLAASNVLARALSFYKYLCQKQIAKNLRKPNSDKAGIISQADAKQLTQSVETQSKLRQLAFSGNRGRGGRGNRWNKRPWRQRGGGGRSRGNRNRYPTYFRNNQQNQQDQKHQQ